MEVLGNKSSLAVEYAIQSSRNSIGYARLWINGHFLGSLYDTIYIDGYLIGGLTEILKKNRLDERYLTSDETAIFALLEKDRAADDERYDMASRYTVNLGTWTDYFNVYSYRLTDAKGAILWQFRDNNDDLLDLATYPTRVFSEQFEYDELEEVIRKVSAVLAKALEHEIHTSETEKWKRENQAALQELNRITDEQGLLSDGDRTF